MAPKKRSKISRSAAASSFDRNKFLSVDAKKRFWEVTVFREPIRERGFDFSSGLGRSVEENFISRGWGKLLENPQPGVKNVVREFYANAVDSDDGSTTVQRTKVDFSRNGINQFLCSPTVDNDDYNRFLDGTIDYGRVLNYLCKKGASWKMSGSKEALEVISFRSAFLKEDAKILFYFVSARLLPSSHTSDVIKDRALLLYSILKGYSIDLGMLLHHEILRCATAKNQGLYFPSLITGLCKVAGMPWAKDEDHVHPRSLIKSFMKGRSKVGSTARLSYSGSSSSRPLTQRQRLEIVEKHLHYTHKCQQALADMLRANATAMGMNMERYPTLPVNPFAELEDDSAEEEDGIDDDEEGSKTCGDEDEENDGEEHGQQDTD